MTIFTIRQKMIDQGVVSIDVGDTDSVGVLDQPTKIPIFSDSTIVDLQVFLKRLGFDTTLDGYFGPKSLEAVQTLFGPHWDAFYANPEDALEEDTSEEALKEEGLKQEALKEPWNISVPISEDDVPDDPWVLKIPTSEITPTPTNTELTPRLYEIPDIPFWYQSEEGIKDIRLGDDSDPNNDTLQQSGCALLSCAEYLSFIGNREVHPKELDAWLDANNGYVNGDQLNWLSITEFAEKVLDIPNLEHGAYRDSYDFNDPEIFEILEQQLKRGNPVIGRIAYGKQEKRTRHFVLILGYDSGTGRYWFHDPGTQFGNGYMPTQNKRRIEKDYFLVGLNLFRET